MKTSRFIVHVSEGRQVEKELSEVPDLAISEPKHSLSLPGVKVSKCPFCLKYFDLRFDHSQIHSEY